MAGAVWCTSVRTCRQNQRRGDALAFHTRLKGVVDGGQWSVGRHEERFSIGILELHVICAHAPSHVSAKGGGSRLAHMP